VEEGGGGESGEDGQEGGTLRGALVDGEGVRCVSIKGKADGAVGHKAVDPGTGEGVDTKAGEDVDCEVRVKVVEEAGDIKEEDHSHAARSNSLFCFVLKGGGGIRSRVVCVRPELARAEEVKVVDVGAEPISHHL